MRTQRELQTETEQLKDALFNLNLKLELLKKQNNELKDQVDEANSRIEELEPFEEKNLDLQEQNDRLRLTMQHMEEENIRMQEENRAILQIQDESVRNMDKQHVALDEAAEIIFGLESSKAEVMEENAKLKEQIASLQAQASENQVDGTAKEKYPARVYSIDESRPSTSHFDSDYYSQPASPQVKASKESLRPRTSYSERTRHFLELHHEGIRSTQDLKKRLSDASMRTSVRQPSPVPEVPQIPSTYQQEAQSPEAKGIRRITKRYRDMKLPKVNTAAASAANPPSAPQTPTGQTEGLRGLFRDVISRDSMARRSSSGSTKSILDVKPPSSPHSILSPRRFQVPPRHSSNHSRNASADNIPKHGSKPDQEQQVEAGWAESHPRSSVLSDDLNLDIRRKDQWWRSVERLTQSKTMSPALRPGSRSSNSPLAPPYNEQDFLFNPREDEDQFLRRTHSHRRQRR